MNLELDMKDSPILVLSIKVSLMRSVVVAVEYYRRLSEVVRCSLQGAALVALALLGFRKFMI